MVRIEPVSTDVAGVFSIRLESGADFAEVMGQELVKRALEVSAAGGHNLLWVRSPDRNEMRPRVLLTR